MPRYLRPFASVSLFFATSYATLLFLAAPSVGQLTMEGMRIISQAPVTIAGAPEAGDLFGWSLATGDFDGDGYDDLVVGIPYEDVGSEQNAGAIEIFYGSPTGLSVEGHQLITANTNGVPGVAEAGDRFGETLVAFDYDDNGLDDLAIGVPGEDVSGVANAGGVVILRSNSNGVGTIGSPPFWTESVLFPGQTVEAGSMMGQALAAADFDGDGKEDLAIGVPGDTVNGLAESGSFILLYGENSTPGDSRRERFDGTAEGLQGEGHGVGSALGAGRLDGLADHPDLLVGIPGIGSGAVVGAGVVYRGSASGLFFDIDNFPNVTGITTVPGPLTWPVAVGDMTGHGVDSAALGIYLEAVDGAEQGYVAFLTPGTRDYLELGELTTPQDLSFFGAGLAIADFDQDGLDDLLVGAPGIGIDDDLLFSGAVFLLPGRAGVGPDVIGSRTWGLGDLGFEPSSVDDFLGYSLAAGDFNGDGYPEAALGIPGRDIGEEVEAGIVVILANRAGLLFADGFESGDLSAW